ncbi:hypothetical protein PHYPSEUDO_009517 [Phytophthora pseudosyringae]|uniref:Uncharacterized protein n=1 Tax=Phytophthora pseudosyringae TaxID=221518 RepID=A0A8T1VF08_9STRA|nr:hypothetical protein PHYPSEUDO_009517 [Phytophthora pseudosyringae]
MKLRKTVTLLYILTARVVLAGESDAVFGSDEAASTTADFAGQVEAVQVATSVSSTAQSGTSASNSTGANTTALFNSLLVATSTDASAASTVTQEHTTQQSPVASSLNATESTTQAQIITTSPASSAVSAVGLLEVEDIVDYAEELRTYFPNGTEEQIISLLNNSNIVIKDLPTGVCVCLGLDVPTDYLNLASDVISVVDKVLIQVMEKGSSLLSDKTMYFDRWRPGLLGLPGSGGGSLVINWHDINRDGVFAADV